jgi:hypothetical protein
MSPAAVREGTGYCKARFALFAHSAKIYITDFVAASALVHEPV